MRYYTAKGDKGTTRLFNCPEGTRLSKGEGVFELLGGVDELNSFVGLCRAVAARSGFSGISEKDRKAFTSSLLTIQENLFLIQSELAGAKHSFSKKKAEDAENAIKHFSELFPKIDSFVIPGSTELGGLLDVSRTIARRIERAYVRHHDKAKRNDEGNPSVLTYLNRLSSLLYVLARTANHAHSALEQAPTYK